MGTNVEGTQMSNTPRTDAATVRMERLDGDIDEVVSADFARQLERELIAATNRGGPTISSGPWQAKRHHDAGEKP